MRTLGDRIAVMTIGILFAYILLIFVRLWGFPELPYLTHAIGVMYLFSLYLIITKWRSKQNESESTV